MTRLPQDSHTYRAIEGDNAQWSLSEMLLARIANSLTQANYQRGGKRTPDKDLIKLPGTESSKKPKKRQEKSLSRAEFDALFTGG